MFHLLGLELWFMEKSCMISQGMSESILTNLPSTMRILTRECRNGIVYFLLNYSHSYVNMFPQPTRSMIFLAHNDNDILRPGDIESVPFLLKH